MVVLRGNGIGEGISIGRLLFVQKKDRVTETITQDTEEEHSCFARACERAADRLRVLAAEAKMVAGAEAAAIFETQELLLTEEQFVKGVNAYIENKKATAAEAARSVGEQLAERMRSIPDAYIRERAADVLDVAELVIQMLEQEKPQTAENFVSENVEGALPVIAAAEDLLPGQVLELSQKQVAGFVLRKGSELSHAVILAKGMGIPVVVNVGDTLSEEYDGTVAVLDSGAGELIVEPDEESLQTVPERNRMAETYRKELAAFRDKETVTKDGTIIRLYANAGNLKQVEEALANGAEGIGLFRSEQLFLESDGPLDEEEQFAIYRQILMLMDGREVIIRTFDIGADKQVAFLGLPKEENPALGLRGIRLCLRKPEFFKIQLRALYRAGVYGKLGIMYPMINSVEEVRYLRETERQVKAELAAEGIAFEENVAVGIMVETPAAALVSDELANLVDFFSIGTNDLTQYTLATDRQNSEVAEFANPYHKAVLKLLQMTVESGHAAGKSVSICGELAADFRVTETLVKMGIDKLSVPPGDILRMRERISQLHLLEE